MILAAVIGTFVLDLGQNVQNTGPSASMGFEDADADYDPTVSGLEDFILIEHQSGESLDGDAIRIVVRNVSTNAVIAEYDQGTINSPEVNDVHFKLNDATLQSADTVQVGDTIMVQIDDATNTVSDGADYSVTITSTETDNRIGTGTVEVQ